MANFEQDNYLPCQDYEGRELSNYEGFTAFYHEDTERWYFAMVSKSGKVMLRSEGYTSEAGRNNGIESVMRNRDIAERYGKFESESGKMFVILRAGNKQEIARSCWQDAGTNFDDYVARCASTFVEKVAVAAEVPAAVRANNRAEDEYLACESYGNRGGTDKYEGFSLFEENGQFFFSMLDRAGRVLLISESYPSEGARNNGVESVMRNRDIRERYVVRQSADGSSFVSLRAGNNQEIARSCDQTSEGDAIGWITQSMAYNVVEEKAAEAAPVAARANDRAEDDYMPCEYYRDRDRSAKYSDFSTWQDAETSEYYFAWVAKDGSVILKSESYPNAAVRDNGMESVVKNRDIEARWAEKEDEHGFYLSLKAGNHQEIGRSCHYNERGAGWNWMSWKAPAAPVVVEKVVVAAPVVVEEVKIEAPIVVEPEVLVAAATAPLIVEKLVEEKPKVVIEVKKEAPKVVIETKKVEVKKAEPAYVAPKTTVYTKPVTPVIVENVVEETSAGGFKWWWLLPLLLLPLLFYLCGGCEKCKKVEAPVISAPVVPPAPAPIPVPVPVKPTCNCTGNADALFNIPTGATAKKLSRLGTNPEFGDSHSCTEGVDFYTKLVKAAKNNPTDKRFLDRVFTGMGYKNGLADATSEMFSEVVLPIGTTGNLGYSKMHKTGYYTLPDAERDREAFRIKSANGCDVHFMKTCGNHFFFCGN